MRSLLLEITKDFVNTENKSQFEIHFSDLTAYTTDSLWITTFDSFFLPIDWYADKIGDPEPKLEKFHSAIIKENGDYYLVDNKFVQEYSHWVREDWDELFCFSGKVEDFEEIMKLGAERELLATLAINEKINEKFKMEFIIENWDASFWRILSNKDFYIDYLKNKFNGNPMFHIKEESVIKPWLVPDSWKD